MRIQILPLFVVGAVLSCTPAAVDGSVVVPDTGPVAGADIRSLVEGGPYDLRIFDGEFAGTVGRSTWNFDAATVTGSFTTADGQSGTFSNPISVRGNQLCSGAGAAQQCHFVYPYRNGFMEVTEAGSVHATSVPN